MKSQLCPFRFLTSCIKDPLKSANLVLNQVTKSSSKSCRKDLHRFLNLRCNPGVLVLALWTDPSCWGKSGSAFSMFLPNPQTTPFNNGILCNIHNAN